MGGREGARGTSAPRSDVWAAFQRQQLMLAHSEEGPLTGERKATVRSGGKGNLVIAPPPSPGGVEDRRDRDSQSLFCLPTSLGSRAVTLSPVF